jgi:glyoxylate utilization-related uncharacterized protein
VQADNWSTLKVNQEFIDGAYDMMCKGRLIGVAVISIGVVLSIVASGQSRPLAQARTAQPLTVSMVALLGSPKQYDGKLIRVIGVLSIKFESNALYLHEEDYDYGITKNSFFIRLTEEQEKKFRVLDKKHVIVEGKFSANGPEAREMTSGAIFDISRLEKWGTLDDLKHK